MKGILVSFMILIKNGKLPSGNKYDILIHNRQVAMMSKHIPRVLPLRRTFWENGRPPALLSIIDATDMIVSPGLVDLHVHFREPGFTYKEDISSGAAAAAAGGVTSCAFMANTAPVLDNAEIIRSLSRKIAKASVNCHPIGAVTMRLEGEALTDFAALKAVGVVALSDDGLPIRKADVMENALRLARDLDMLIISHCEGAGEFGEAEMAERDIELAKKTGARLHIAHVSLAETVDVIRRGKEDGAPVTAEVCPHHFSLTSDEVEKRGAMATMSPPLASRRDVDAVIEGLCDGTIDAIATDHAPHSVDEKSRPVGTAPNGIIGLETSLGVSLTHLYHTKILGISEIVSLMSRSPAQILGLNAGRLQVGSPADIVIFDPNESWIVYANDFRSKARNTPYNGVILKGKVKHTIVAGELV